MRKKDTQFNFRMPADLKERLMERAQSNNRTLTSEIVLRLESSFSREDSPDYRAENRPTRDEVLTLLLHGMTAGLDAFERARDQGASSADMHRRMKQAIIDALRAGEE